MRSFISEDDIEEKILSFLSTSEFNYDIIKCPADTAFRDDLNDGTNRKSKTQCVLPSILDKSLRRINPKISSDKIEEVYKELTKDFAGTALEDVNFSNYSKIRNSIKVNIKDKNGNDDFDFVKIIDFENPLNNTFTAVSQMWIKGQYNYRRPDIIIFINGLPLVFIELKNSTVKVEEAYNKNLKSYIKDIPSLFAFNQICVLSNAIETRVGAYNATYDFFFEWLKIDSEKEKVDREAVKKDMLSVEKFIRGLLNKEKLIDYIENFILFENKSVKIIAKNHQYLGVNNLIDSLKKKEELNGKLGVFWHTQGSGKSYSMVMFTRKVQRKIVGNYTFLVITDREDLDTQIHKNFVGTGVIGKDEECQPKDSAQLRQFLQQNKPMIFTLIHKFRYDKTKKYPVLSTRNDIIVMVDEAHRTQYKDLAENMRTALPNANFIAFTGTPLLGSKRLTNQWFGEYVSEYNFAQSVEDGSTVPLFYSRRVPEVGLQNNFLDDDVVEIIESENLNEAEQRVLENSGSRILEVIKRDDRLDKIAQDIAHHFPRRGFLGKGMVISVDKFTAVKMYNKVQHYWAVEKQNIIKERNLAKTKEERDKLTNILNYMDSVEMAVIVSEEADEDKKFAKQGLSIAPHREKMNSIIDGKDIEDRFKDPADNLQLVFVCAMWLTGFDVKSISTLYLDKPMKSHTLMQAIARANRVFPGKTSGIIVDYVNVFGYMKRALGDYAIGDDDSVMPVKDIDKLISLLDSNIIQLDEFLQTFDISIDNVLELDDTFKKIEELRFAYNKILEKEQTKDKFKILSNTMINLYEASKPEIFERGWSNDKFSPLVYIHGLFNNYIDDEKIQRAKNRLAQVLDNSVESSKTEDNDNGYVIHGTKVIDLSKLDVSDVKKIIKESPYKAVEIDDLKAFIEELLEQMINKNCNRVTFSVRYKNIIDRYNAGGSENEEYYNQLLELIEEFKKEQSRATLEGLTEEELEIFDLLVKGKTLSKAEEQKVKLAAKNLYKNLQRIKKIC